MSDEKTYSINTPGVVGEVIDGELVAMHLESGCYYHANATGAVIWTCIEQGMNSSDISMRVQKQYGIDAERAMQDVHSFIETLLNEKLIRVAERADIVSAGDEVARAEAQYVAPVLKKHEDMKELLLLDPIHDVGEGAWPMEEVK